MITSILNLMKNEKKSGKYNMILCYVHINFVKDNRNRKMESVYK